MKRLALLGLIMAMVILGGNYVFADESQISSLVTANVQNTFTVAFYPRSGVDNPDPNIQFPSGGPILFTDVDPSETIVYPDGRAENDGKSDVGILCLSNIGQQFYLKIHMTSATIEDDNLVVYIPAKAYNRNQDPSEELGGVQHSEGWYPLWKDTPHTVYMADSNHWNTLSWGTLLTFSFALIPSGQFTPDVGVPCNGTPLSAGSHSATIYYTMSTTP